MGFGGESPEDLDELLDVTGPPPPSSVSQSKSCFLKNIGELGLMDSSISLASEELEAGVDLSCPLVPTCLWSDGVLPAPPSMLSAFLVSPFLCLPLPSPSVNFTSS